MNVRVRFAPSPTGYLHLGGARTALYNWLFARQHNGTFVLRIDDTDEARSTEESTRQIIESLKWLGLEWDEGPIVGGPHAPYVQSQRGPIYAEYVQKLLDSGHAYRCYDTPEELAAERERARAERRPVRLAERCLNLSERERRRLEAEGRRPAVFMRVEEGPIVINDLVQGRVKVESETINDFIIMRSDGKPLYLFTSPIDDYVMGITHVIRGADHLPNTPKQVLIYRALGVEPPLFAHLPLVLGSPKGEKLSKRRHGDLVEIGKYKREGYLPQAMINYLARLGWSYDDRQEIFSVEELLEKFSLERVGSSASVFDLKKLQWLNKHYIMQMSLSERTDAVIPFLRQAGLLPEEPLSPERRAWLEKVVEAVGDRMTVLQDVTQHCAFLLQGDDAYEYNPKDFRKYLQKEGVGEALRQIRTELASVEPFDAPTLESQVRAFVERTGIKIWQPLRVALTGVSRGPGLFEIMELLGKESTLARIDRALAQLNG